MSDARQRPLPDDVARDMEHDAERVALASVWTALAAAEPVPSVTPAETSTMWANITAATGAPAIERPPASAHSAPAARRPTAPASARPAWALRRRTAAIAAAVVLVVAGFLGRPGRWHEVQVPLAQQQVVSLPDGSEVTLSAGARLRYRDGFRGWFGRAADRRTELDGTAYFAVASDGRPFSVRTYNAVVRVLGTTFEVQAWPTQASGTAVTVAEGRVALAGSRGDALTLTAGDRATVADATTAPALAMPVAAERVAPWRRGGFVAVDEPLSDVVAALERQFDVSITIADPDLGARRITLYYPEAALDRVLGDLATMQSLAVERRRDGYLVRRP